MNINRDKKTTKKCRYHGQLTIDEIYITEAGSQRCLLCKSKKPPILSIVESKHNIQRRHPVTSFCKKCNTRKPIEEFYLNPSTSMLCKPCEKIRKSEYRKRPEVRQREYIYEMKRFYKKKYGITFEDYDAMIKKQKGLCAICRKPSTKIDCRLKKIQRLHVDHCHKTKKVRGLLCNKCNQGIGFFDDNILIFESCIRYLQNGYIEEKLMQNEVR